MRKILYTLGCLLCFTNLFTAKAQLSNADLSLFINSFTDPIYLSYWNYPLKWYIHDSVKSKAQLTQYLESDFPFTPSDINKNIINEISLGKYQFDTSLNSSFNAYPSIYGQTDPVVKLTYSLHQKNDTAYAAFTNSTLSNTGNCKTAFLLLHGTGTNTTSQFMQNNGYANILCAVKSKCAEYGDVFSYCKPNEDWRAIYWNRKKLGDYIFGYLEATGHNYGTDYLIENIAFVKYLKQHYERVVLLGISEGGYAALLNSLYSEPDAAVISGGYSISFDTYLWSQFVLSSRFGNLPQVVIRDTVKNTINANNTKYLFTWGDADPVALMDPEHDYHYTENYLNNPAKCSYYYNFVNHTFPPCSALDTFFQKVISQPKVNIYVDESICKSDSVRLNLKFCGQSPFQAQLFRNGTFVTTINSISDSMGLTLFQAGSYQLKNIDDASSALGINSQVYHFVKDPSIGYNLVSNNFICDSNKSELKFNLTGTSPWILKKVSNNNIQFDTLNQAANLQYYQNGQLLFSEISDSNHCKLVLNQPIDIADSMVDINFMATQFNCNIVKYALPVALKGRSPWTIKYVKNSIASQVITSNTSPTLTFDNGNYLFQNVIDGNGCNKLINNSYAFNADTLEVQLGSISYDCDSVKMKLPIQVEGNFPITLNYTKDNVAKQLILNSSVYSLFLSNGNYVFSQAIDSKSCSINLNSSFNVNVDTLMYTLSPATYSCDSNKNLIHFELAGNSPWVISYTENNVSKQITSNIASFDKLFMNGLYSFNTISDFYGCVKSINKVYNFSKDTLEFATTNPIYSCDSNKSKIHFELEGNGPWNINYFKNSIPQLLSTSTASFDKYFDNGNYQFYQIADATCQKSLSTNYSMAFNPLNFVSLLPTYHCDSNKTKIHFDLQGNPPFVINYYQDNISKQIVSSQNSFDKFFSNGTYHFDYLSDNTGCTKLMNQTFNFNFSPITYTISAPIYNCDSNKVQVHFDFTGNPGWTLQYQKNSVLNSITTTNSSIDAYFDSGSYFISSVNDQTACYKTINSSFNVNYSALGLNLVQLPFNCDSNKSALQFNLQGNSPWIISYLENGIPKQFITSNAQTEKLFSNGQYVFTGITDNTNCFLAVNESFEFNHQPLTISLVNKQYDCDSNKYHVQYLLTGTAPWTFSYTNGVNTFTKIFHQSDASFFLPTGNWTIVSVSDSNSCSKVINENYISSFYPISASITQMFYNCDSNKFQVNLDLGGNPNFKLFYNEFGAGGNVTNHFTTTSNKDSFYFPNGNYLITHLEDTSHCIFPINQYLNPNYNLLSYQKLSSEFNCNLGKWQVMYALQGNGPWIISYKDLNTNTISQTTFYNANATLTFTEGDFLIMQIQDATCILSMADTIHNKFKLLQSNLQMSSVNCDTGKTMFIVNSTGNKPFTYNYIHDSQAGNFLTSKNIDTFYLQKGTWYFENVIDSLTCKFTFNQPYQTIFEPFEFHTISSNYVCDKDSTMIDFDITHSNPITIHYLRNQLLNQIVIDTQNKFLFGNGNYTWIEAIDTFGCKQKLNLLDSIHNEAVKFDWVSQSANCDSRLFEEQFNLHGKAPWTLTYNVNNIDQSVVFTDSLVQWSIPYEDYFLVSLKDKNDCELILDTATHLFPFLMDNPLLEYKNNRLVTQASPYTYLWYRNNLPIDSLSGNMIPPQGSGSYAVYVKDSAGCIFKSNEVQVDFPNEINIYPNPASGNFSILVNENYGEFWQYIISDMSGKKLLEGISKSPYEQINVDALAHGLYQIRISYDPEISQTKKVFQLLIQ